MVVVAGAEVGGLADVVGGVEASGATVVTVVDWVRVTGAVEVVVDELCVVGMVVVTPLLLGGIVVVVVVVGAAVVVVVVTGIVVVTEGRVTGGDVGGVTGETAS